MDDIIQKIISETGLDKAEVERRVDEKQKEFSGLVSKEGSAYILAKELGLDLVRKAKKELTIDRIVSGLRNLNFSSRILRKFDAREFERDGKKGRVANIVLGDGTGTVRMSLWDSQIDILNNIGVGNAVEIFGAYTKQDNRGDTEVRLGMGGGIKVLENSKIPEIREIKSSFNNNIIKCSLNELKDGTLAEVRGSIVQLFETEIFYEVCPKCGSRIKDEKDFVCNEHGKVEPVYTLVVSGVIDDGTGNVRVVCFRDNAAKLLGMDMNEVLDKRGKLFEGVNILGKEFVFIGRARRNKMFDRLEFIASDLKEVDVKSEVNSIINSFGVNS